MRDFFIRLIVNAMALAATAYILPGIHIDMGLGSLLLVAFVFGIVNAIVKPVITILSCPLIIVTLGLFYLVVNGLMLLITDELAGGRFDVDGLLWAVLGGLVFGIIGSILESALGLNDKDDEKETVIINR
ncbi:MAG TPA: phage holin family protein [Aggregatilinea sp.]|jgi:putative membrane protein|uniref:phage holin family protein n=1 Tax=Aggregatilinea sp. TaxID=2806333 RepID=UPI002CEA7DA1|nr:phage holin family protein [Aggregatilinea sp.]HML22782.1 phage holin family protein [Aggregatilinea sp.]